MQAQLKRPVNFTDAYIDALVLNVYAGPGPTEVWIDDLESGPGRRGRCQSNAQAGGRPAILDQAECRNIPPRRRTQ